MKFLFSWGPHVSGSAFAEKPSRSDPIVDEFKNEVPSSSKREQPWLSSVYGLPAANGASKRFEPKRKNVENVLAHP
uniref:Uncharacterized protein n=1 Tax=Leersia perrieri TaxID=77586 RepID=A0A0D9XBW6_9ORYZ